MHSHKTVERSTASLGVFLAITVGSAMPGLAQTTMVAGDGTANTLVNGNNLAACSVGL